MASIVVKGKAECISIVAPSQEDEEYSEDPLREDVKDTVESLLGVWVNNISAFGDAPGDGVKETAKIISAFDLHNDGRLTAKTTPKPQA